MTHDSLSSSSPISRAIGRIPSGLFIVTVREDSTDRGLLASWLQQAGFAPASVTVAVQHGRDIGAMIERTGRLVVNQLSEGQHRLMRHFARPNPADRDPFESVETLEPDRARGGLVLASAMNYLDVEVSGHLDGGDHRIFLGSIVGGGVLREDAKPFVHLRRNGFHY
jgi:flavin reductase (DIM6/NTAB) family NADH-FMN oxidoreductase RutF